MRRGSAVRSPVTEMSFHAESRDSCRLGRGLNVEFSLRRVISANARGHVARAEILGASRIFIGFNFINKIYVFSLSTSMYQFGEVEVINL